MPVLPIHSLLSIPSRTSSGATEQQLSALADAGMRVICAQLVGGAGPGGWHVAHWDGRDSRGAELASGVYLYRLRVGSHVETRRLLLLR